MTIVLVFLTVLMSLLSIVSTAYAAGALSFTVTTTPTTVETGEIVEYLLDFSCGGVTGGCGSLNIPFDYDQSRFELITPVSVSSGFSAGVDTVNGLVTITDPTFNDGDAGQATIQLRALRTLTTGENVPGVDVTATISDPSGPPAITINTPNIVISPPTEQWSSNKSIIAPTAGVPPAPNNGSNGAYATYRVQYCSDSSTGNLPISNAVLVDQFPVGAEVSNISDGGYIGDADGTANPLGNYIFWTLGNLLSNAGCINRTYDIVYPTSAGFTTDPATTASTLNYARAFENGIPPNAGVCTTNCVGENSDEPTLGSAQGEPTVNKGIDDTRPIANPGIANFTMQFNTNALNTDMVDVTMRDVIPLQVSGGGMPALDVFSIYTGTWQTTYGSFTMPDAELRVTFQDGTVDTYTANGSGSTIDLGTSTTFAGTRTATNKVTQIELVFPYVPINFTFSNPLRATFTPSAGMPASDYGHPLPNQSYQNCAVMDYPTADNPPVVGGFNQDCANALITDDNTSVIDWTKTATGNNGPIDNEDIVTFGLRLSYDSQSSSNLPSTLTYTDELDEILDLVDWADIYPIGSGTLFNFTPPTNMVGGDVVPEPYMRVQYNTPTAGKTTVQFIWTANPATDLTGGNVYYINGALVNAATAPANTITLSPPTGADKVILVEFKGRVKSIADGGRAGTYVNSVNVDANSPELACQGATTLTEDCDTSVNFQVREVANISAFKWVRSTLDADKQIRPDRTSYNGFVTNPNFECASPIGTDRVLRNDTTGMTLIPSDIPTTDDYSRAPCAAQGNPGEPFEYLMEITNDGNINLDEFILYDILPYIGDTGVSQATINQTRDTEFMVWLRQPTVANPTLPVRVTEPASFPYVVEYSTSTNPCRPEMSNSADESSTAWTPGCDNTSWTTTPADWNAVRSFRIRQTNNTTYTVPPSESIRIEIDAYIPTHDELTAAGFPASTNEAERALVAEVAWNNYAYRFTSDSTSRRLLTAEPRKVGIRIPERLSVGNRVWIDDGGNTVTADADDRERDATTSTERGVGGVTLQLYRWDGSGAQPTGVGTLANAQLIAETTTSTDNPTTTTVDEGGYYLFEIDQRARGDFGGSAETPYDWFDNGTTLYSLRPGQYFIYIPPSNFDNATDPLYNYISSTGIDTSNTTDDRDRGSDNGTGAQVDPPTHGVVGEWFTLEFAGTPTGEADRYAPTGTQADPYGPYGRGNYFQRDTYSDLIRDFGFIKPMSLGNRVWIDDGGEAAERAGTGTFVSSQKNDGQFNGDEQTVAGVTIQLYHDGNNDGTVDVTDAADLLATTITNADGYYLFPGLKPGNYRVHIPAGEFFIDGVDAGYNGTNTAADGTLAYHVSTTGWTTQQTDGTAIASFVDTRDNGIDVTNPRSTGVSSSLITLTRDSETSAETDFESGTDPNQNNGYVGNQAVENQNNDLTIDFGFLKPPMSLGNVIWRDYNNNGVRDNVGNAAVEPGIENVRVNLYRDDNGDGIPDGGIIGWTETDGNGYYLFDRYSISGADIRTATDVRDLQPGRYIVEVDPDEFLSTGTLYNYFSSDDPTGAANDNTDNNDNGTGDDGNTPYGAGGSGTRLRSATALLVPHAEPTSETDNAGVTMPEHGTSVTAYGISTDGSQATAIYTTDITDNMSDRTWDFGVYKKFSIGNRVWFDRFRDASTVNGDGIRQAASDEPGVNNVLMQLWTDDGTGGLGTLVAETRTTSDGYYLFDETTTVTAPGVDDPNDTPIYQGDYIVYIPPINFAQDADPSITGNQPGPLFGYINSDNGNPVAITSGAFDNQTDSVLNGGDENGINATPGTPSTYPVTAGVRSSTIQLRYENEPTSEADRDPARTTNVDGVQVEDDNSDLTIDFGFYQAVSIGNRVWYDANRDGLISPAIGTWPAESGINGVTVYLYRDEVNNGSGAPTPDGIPDDPAAIAIEQTANGGYYLFDRLDTDATTATGSGDGAGGPLAPGNYIVGIPASEFGTGQELFTYVSTATRESNPYSTPPVAAQPTDNNQDSDDNGIDYRDNNTISPAWTSNVYSETINLAHYQEASPLNSNDDTDLDTTLPANAREGLQVRDESGNMTVDFGFFIPMAIGNRVWLDNNDQIQQLGSENGVANVALTLFRDVDGDGTVDTGTPYRTTTTDTNGYYLFDDLPEGIYRVRVDASNFQNGGTPGALYDVANSGPYFSSEDTNTALLNDDGGDLNDNGLDNLAPQTNGIFSRDITLSLNSEPAQSGSTSSNNDTDLQTGLTDGGVEGRYNEIDRNTDLTVDFGFYTTLMSVGNRVFYDYNNNGVVDGIDYNNDSTIDLPDVGIPNVTVRLYRYQDAAGTTMLDSSGNVITGGSTDNPTHAIRQTVTSADNAATAGVDEAGFYIFDGLLPGYYRVVVVEENFRTGGTLRDYLSTQDRGDNPKDVNGDSATTANANNGMATGDPFENGTDTLTPQNGGIVSPVLRLQPASEPQNEPYKTDTNSTPDGVVDDGQPNIEDSNGDMTQDFGFYRPQSIGNRVWFDTNSNGVWDTGELGASGVTLTLYQDTNNNGVFDSATDQIANYYYDNDGSGPNAAAYQNAVDTTDSNGFYLFENVPPGRYFVVVNDTNFNASNPLNGWTSTSPDVNDSTTDRDDNGINPATAGNPVPSQLIDLTVSGTSYQTQPLNEPEPSLNSADGTSYIGNNGELDVHSNLTYDFGFVRTDLMSLGNRVWYDEDGDGIINGGTGGTNNLFGNDEWNGAGIANVALSLYRDNVNNTTGATTPDGIPDGAALATTTTSADDPATTGVDEGGYYIFTNLVPGNYIVGVDASNFNAGNPLYELRSTLTGTNNTTRTNTGENNDNGIDTLNPTYGIISETVNLTQNAEPTDEQAQDKGADGDGSGIDNDDSDLTIDFGFHEPMSLGNQIFYDYNDNGVKDTTETGVPAGVTVLLYRTDSSGAPVGGGDITNPADAIATDTTDADGFYLFSNLPPGYYRVVVSETNFTTSTNPIFGMRSSTGVESGTVDGNTNIDGDNNDNGIDPASTTVYTTDGVASPVVVLGSRSMTPTEPTGETVSNNTADGPDRRGTNGETDANSNLAVDFGFVPTTYYSIGNRVWVDNGSDGAGGTTAANVRNGVFDTGETGIAGVTVNLYRDITGGVPTNPAAPYRTTTTDANGYYIFDGLPADEYIVSLAPSNFNVGGALTGYASTTANVNPASVPATETPNTSDNNDNRQLPAAGTLPHPSYGIISAVYELGNTGGEPTGESSPDNAGSDSAGFAPDGTTAIPDNQSDLTIDFGVYKPLSLGNRVWFDANNNGLIDTTENGVANVTVSLYADTNGDGTPDSATPLQTDTTDSNGYYLFNNLLPGQYVIAVDNGNFSASNPLNGFTSSTGFTASPATPNAGVDLDDNGIDTLNATYGILSPTITLASDNAPLNESQTSGQAADGPNFRGVNNEADNNSDMTWDFGFFSDPMSLGNRVWIDANGNGTFDNGETPVANVQLELYAAIDTNGDGTPDSPASTPLRTTTTDADGYYIFENLPPGAYIVKVTRNNWATSAPLDGYYSTTTGAADKTTDNNDNGIDNTNPETNGILSNIITLVRNSEPTSESSPDNAGADDTGDKPDGSPIDDDDSNLTVDFGFRTAFDWGDAPDTYGTDNNTTNGGAGNDGNEVGPSHRIIPQLRLGSIIDDETSGQPSTGADGDDTNGGSDDEDGITFPSQIIPQTTMTLTAEVFNNTGSDANLIAWFDWNGNGVFDEQYDSNGDGTPDTPEYVTVTVPSSATAQNIRVDVPVPENADIMTGGSTYARFRLTTDSIDATEPTGSKNDGEVEDYRITVNPPGVSFQKEAVDSNNNTVNSTVAGQPLTYVITLENSASGTSLVDQTFTDSLPTGATNGFDPSTVSWTCTGTNGATCNAANEATANGTGNPVTTNVDLPAGGRLVFRITATVNSTANANITNDATLQPINLTASRTTGVIFDPPTGVKTGVVQGGNVIRWTMVWFNTGARQFATITDTLPASQTFNGNLVCSATDSDPTQNGAAGVGTETTLCQESGGTITWQGYIDTGNTNRLEIAFDVIVPGQGTYNNTATFNGTSTTSATGSVNTGNPPGNAVGELLDPVIVKFVRPEFALPGENVVWTIIVRNPNVATPLYGVSFSDNVPAMFDIISVDADTGNVTVNQNNVRWEAAIMPPLQEVSVRINARLRNDIPPNTSAIVNTVVLMTGDTADATLLTTAGLPPTGETPVVRIVLTSIAAALAAIALMIAVAYRRFKAQMG